MHPLFDDLLGRRQAVPCLFYPVVREIGLTVSQALTDPAAQVRVFEHTARTYPVGAVVRMTELWCEAAACGMACEMPDGGFPQLGSPLCEEADALPASRSRMWKTRSPRRFWRPYGAAHRYLTGRSSPA